MLRYLGGANLYAFEGQPLTVELLTSTDGRDLVTVRPR